MKQSYRSFSMAGLAVAGVVGISAACMTPVPVHAYELHTVSSLIDLLVTRGIIPAVQADRARELADLAERVTSAATGESTGQVSIQVSQLIEVSHLTFAEGEPITGLVLLATNTSNEAMMLSARRGCAVSYRIFDTRTDELLFDSADTEACENTENVRYALDAGEARMFEISHDPEDLLLRSGTYTFELIYPEYGSGSRTVTVE